ncbi:hypothetical protein LCGC14_1420130, partial [marine sediment metagenome]
DKILDYSQQTRSYLMFSDWDNDYFEKFFFSEKIHYELRGQKRVEVPETVPRDSEFTYMPNSIMYLEQQISIATKLNNDDNYDSIIPYMVYGDGTFVPTLQFADSGGNRPIPEFYQEYPIFVSPEIYSSSDLYKDDYHSIYKVYDGSTSTIQLIPSDYSNSFTLHSDVMSFDAYFIDASRQVRETFSIGEYTYTKSIHTYEEEFGSYSDCYTFNSDTGTIELDSSINTLFSKKIASYKLLYPDSEPSFVLEFHIEKYRSLEDLRELSSEEVTRIATMQAAHESILEYTYQHSIATSTQTKLSSAAYTAYITFISVMATVIPVIVGTTIAKIASASIDTIAIGASLVDIASSSSGSSILSILSASALKLVWVVASEIGEELLLDPWVEATVSTAVGDAGGGLLAQAFATSFAESGRETFMGGVSHIYKSAISSIIHTKTQVQSEISAKNKIQEQIQKIKEGIKADESKKTRMRALLMIAGSTLALFMDLVSGVPIVAIGYSVGMGSAIAYQGIKNARSLKSMVRQVHPHPRHIEFEAVRTDFDWNAFIEHTNRMIEKPGINFMPDTEFSGINLGWDSEIQERLFLKNKENNELIIKISVDAINQLFRAYKSVEQNLPPSLKRKYGLNVYKSNVERIETGIRKVISSKKIQRMIEGALIAVKQHILSEDNQFLKNLVEYKKLSLAIESIDLKTKQLDSSTEGRSIPQRVVLFENLRNLLQYQDIFGSKGFTIPLTRFGKLIGRPQIKAFSERNSRMSFPELMETNYKILDLTLKDLKSVGLDYSEYKLRTFKRKASQVIKEFLFSNPYSSPYINKEDIEISEKEGIDYIEHKFDLIRSIGYLLYRSQYSSKFIATKTPFINFRYLQNYIIKPMALTEKKISTLLELFANRKDFNQRDFYVKQTIKDLNIYKNTFAQISSRIVGKYTHVLEELASLTSLILDKEISVFHEDKVEDGRHIADLSIQVDKNFRTRYGALFKQKYQLDLSKIDTINIDFTDSYEGRGYQFVKAKFLKNYQSPTSVSLIILTNHMLYDKTRAKTYIAKFDPYLKALSSSYFPQHIRLDTMEEFISFFEIEDISKGITPLTDFGYIRLLKDQALSHNPDVSNKAFETLYDLYSRAKLTLALLKSNPANAVNILKTKQLNIAKFLGDPNKKIDDFL